MTLEFRLKARYEPPRKELERNAPRPFAAGDRAFDLRG